MLSNKTKVLCKITNFLHKVKHRISLSGVQECTFTYFLNGCRVTNQAGQTNVMKTLTMINIMAAGKDTDIKEATVMILNMTVSTVCDDGIPCCNIQDGIFHESLAPRLYNIFHAQLSCV